MDATKVDFSEVFARIYPNGLPSQCPEASLKEWEGPYFPVQLDAVQAALDSPDIEDLLTQILQHVEGFKFFGIHHDVSTDDGYTWKHEYLYEGPSGELALLVPHEDKDRICHRWCAIYVRHIAPDEIHCATGVFAEQLAIAIKKAATVQEVQPA